MKIWGRPNSINVQKVMWAVGELGLDHERIDVGGAFGGLDTDDYGRMNPNRRIPVLEDGPAIVWESHACVRYLAATYGEGGLWPLDPGSAIDRRSLDGLEIHHTSSASCMSVFGGLIRTPEAGSGCGLRSSMPPAELGKIWHLVRQPPAGADFRARRSTDDGRHPLGVRLLSLRQPADRTPGISIDRSLV